MWGMKPGTEPEIRILHIIDNLIDLDPDIIGLQEINEAVNGDGTDNQGKVIADSLSAHFGIPYYYDKIITHLSWDSQYKEFIGIITKYPVEEKGYHQLATGVFPRKVIWNKISTPSGTVNFFNTHLSYNDSNVRIQQVQQIIDYVNEIENNYPATASILTGDFNDIPSSASIQQLINTDTDTFYISTYAFINPRGLGYTAPSHAPFNKIDYIFLKNTSSITPIESEIVMDQPYSGNLFCSDHFGITTSFQENIMTIENDSSCNPGGYELCQNYPNPFNYQTRIVYLIQQKSLVTIKVFDITGRKIQLLVHEFQTPGEHTLNFNARDLPGGIYLFEIQTDNGKKQKGKMLLLR